MTTNGSTTFGRVAEVELDMNGHSVICLATWEEVPKTRSGIVWRVASGIVILCLLRALVTTSGQLTGKRDK